MQPLSTLTNTMVCEDCRGTGRDDAKTAALAKADADFRHRAKHHGSYVRCWTCNGNGLDPAAFFRWGPHPPLAPRA